MLTDNEKKAMQALRRNDYGDAYSDPTWSFAVVDRLEGIIGNRHACAAVLGSLKKKGLVGVSGPCHNDDSTIWMTDDGRQAYDAANLDS